MRLAAFDHSPAQRSPRPFLLTRDDDFDAHALRRQGWTITAIARHLGDGKPLRTHLAGDRVAGVLARTIEGPSEPRSTGEDGILSGS